MPESLIKVNSLVGTRCKGIRDQSSSLSTSSLRVIVTKKAAYLCPIISPRGGPISGVIEDIQVSGTSFRFDWKSIKCDGDWFRSEKCLTLHPSAVSTRCMEMPALIGGVKYHYKDGSVYASLDSSPSMVIGSCQGGLISHESNCFNFKVRLVGSRGSQQGLAMLASADSKEGIGFVLISLNCSSNLSIHLPCDSRDHYTSISEAEKCHGITDDTKSLEGFTSFTKEEAKVDLISFLHLHNPHVALFSSFWIVLVLCLMFIYTCCCRSH